MKFSALEIGPSQASSSISALLSSESVLPKGHRLKLRGVDFGHVLDASGARGWFGEGHSYHRLLPYFLSFEGSTFVAKTTTLEARTTFAPMKRDGRTTKILGQPRFKMNWRKGAALNALGLPGPGFKALLDTGRWRQIREPFFLSFMAIEESPQESLREVRSFIQLLRRELPNFAVPVGLQVNFSCPNVHPREHVTNFVHHLDEYQALEIPIMVKLSATQSIETALTIDSHPACDAISVSNTIPWREYDDKIDWKGLFGAESPLKQYGGGGLSGAPLLPIVADWVRNARSQGMKKSINAGGGILKPADVDILVQAGADSVFVGSIAFLRPWNLPATIRHANDVFSERSISEPSLHSLPARRRA